MILRNRTIRDAWIAYHQSVAAQAIVSNTSLLAGLVVLDLLLKLPPSGRLLYCIPVFTVTRVSGIRVGAGMALLAAIVGTIMDRIGGQGDAWIVNFIVRYVGMTIIAFKVESMVDRIKTTTDYALHDSLTGVLNCLGFT